MDIIGLMSGTSLDGVDAVRVRFEDHGRMQAIGRHHQAYDATLRQALARVDATTPLGEVLRLDQAVADACASAAQPLLRPADDPNLPDGIALHGQTIWHAPDDDPATTCQIGNPARVAERTGVAVIADFRRRDMAAGGQGAPLAPLFHRALFAGDQPRAVVNLGGIANLTVLDARGGIRQGFDCGPANTLMDRWIASHRGAAYDRDGAWAASGRLLPELYERLLADPYFKRPPPKSTGPEHFNLEWLAGHLGGHEAPADVQATLADVTAGSIADAIMAWADDARDAVLCGGGALNTYLIGRIRQRLPGWPVRSSDALGVPVTDVEAMGFAWLGRAAMQGEALDMQAITGATHPVRLGAIYPA
ncbi:anhydro-N-acetylmuramic acid kinase [Spiribacter pallidus]|uniref:Anhydro-N-acetylmuramic acid kinase n=2 Tax=Spiribacter pallidus TaxID=1987936 RepID=A0ABV3TDE4_9GAMM